MRNSSAMAFEGLIQALIRTLARRMLPILQIHSRALQRGGQGFSRGSASAVAAVLGLLGEDDRPGTQSRATGGLDSGINDHLQDVGVCWHTSLLLLQHRQRSTLHRIPPDLRVDYMKTGGSAFSYSGSHLANRSG